MIRYTAKHSSGATKTRTSRGHLQPVYTHALWHRYTGEPIPGSNWRTGEWACRSMGKLSTVAQEAHRLQKIGDYEIEIVELEASS